MTNENRRDDENIFGDLGRGEGVATRMGPAFAGHDDRQHTNGADQAEAEKAAQEAEMMEGLVMLLSGNMEGLVKLGAVNLDTGKPDLVGIFKALSFAEKQGFLDADKLRAMADGPYEDIAQKVRPLLTLVTFAGEKVGQDALGPLINTMLGIMKGISENPETKALLTHTRATKAASTKAQLDAYTQAGFSHEEAFELLRLDRMQMAAALQNMNNSMQRLQNMAS